MFHIAVYLFDGAAPWIEKTLESVASQEYPDLKVTIIDDGTTDPRIAEALKHHLDQEWRIIRHDTPQGRVKSLKHAIEGSADDVTHILLRGGDWINDPWVIQALIEVYKKHEAKFIYTQFLYYHAATEGYSQRLPTWYRKKKRFEKKGWIFGPLYSFPHSTWKETEFSGGEDFRQDFLLPLMETAGVKVRYFPRITCIHNELAVHVDPIPPSGRSAGGPDLVVKEELIAKAIGDDCTARDEQSPRVSQGV